MVEMRAHDHHFVLQTLVAAFYEADDILGRPNFAFQVHRNVNAQARHNEAHGLERGIDDALQPPQSPALRCQNALGDLLIDPEYREAAEIAVGVKSPGRLAYLG